MKNIYCIALTLLVCSGFSMTHAMSNDTNQSNNNNNQFNSTQHDQSYDNNDDSFNGQPNTHYLQPSQNNIPRGNASSNPNYDSDDDDDSTISSTLYASTVGACITHPVWCAAGLGAMAGTAIYYYRNDIRYEINKIANKLGYKNEKIGRIDELFIDPKSRRR